MTKHQIVVMGVSGCGKSTVGELLAQKLGCRFIDGDDLHSAANKAKMSAGTPLNDEDRWPWLATVGEVLSEPVTSTVVACSALKRIYRNAILEAAPGTVFVHLHGTREVLLERMQTRATHFMKPAMLDSQLAILEPLAAEEPGATFDIERPVELLVQSIFETLTK